VLSEGAAALGEGWSFNLNDSAKLTKLSAYLEAKHKAFKSLGVILPKQEPKKPPKTMKRAPNKKHNARVQPWQVREWLMRQLEGLGILVNRPSKELSGAARRQGAAKAYTLTRAAVVVAWQWAARPFIALVEAAELDTAEWAAAGVS
jgi:hypothetical protein